MTETTKKIYEGNLSYEKGVIYDKMKKKESYYGNRSTGESLICKL